MTPGEELPVPVRPAPVPTTQDVILRREFETVARDSLPRVRASAEKWRNGASVSAAIAFAGTVISGPEVVAQLDSTPRLLLFLSLVLATIAGLVAIYLALLASIGWPKREQIANMRAFRAWEARAADAAQRQLWHSRWLSMVAIVSLAAALLISLFGAINDTKILVGDGNNERCVDSLVFIGSRIYGVEESGRFLLDFEPTVIRPTAECP